MLKPFCPPPWPESAEAVTAPSAVSLGSGTSQTLFSEVRHALRS